MLNPDFKDMLSELVENDVKFLIIGAYALAVHGYPRATGDMDIWIRPKNDNARRTYSALASFGAPLSGISIDDLSSSDVVFQIGVEPSRIDILTTISGVEFDDAWERRMKIEIEGLDIAVISRVDLITNKRSVGRAKDLADIEDLESE